ncbi:thiamine phosphate synthase [Paenibacillus agri]|uniref:Thiamine-phosphate synthase n=1 Tax=Paenibacillus agri TaxID=2744309 RepID=A0A850EWI2_9BACL|nr:thiamine phosphate synthase [Paenibacillus agri]NUU64290.1 thiamine phosphate synthase [Paenibacillus agri]
MSVVDSHKLREQLSLYFIMGTANCRKSPEETLKAAIKGGATMFQFREKGPSALHGQALLELAKSLQCLCRAEGVPFIINDDIELAIQLDADGVHIGQEDEPAASIRQRLGSGKIIGVSAHNLAEVQQAISDGADYLGIGPVYPTPSKDDARAVQGTRLITEIREKGIDIPLVGIGGITAANTAPVIAAGADGISVISAIAGAADATAAAREFVQAIERAHIRP